MKRDAKSNERAGEAEGADRGHRMEPTSVPSHPASRENRGPTGSGPEEGDARQRGRTHPPQVRDSVRDGHPTRVPGLRQIDPSETLLAAFLDGDFGVAYQAAKELSEAYHEALAEASRLRFQVNFGSQLCHNCEGMRAGPGVIATCFQVQRCDFTNVKEGGEDLRVKRVVRRLLDDK